MPVTLRPPDGYKPVRNNTVAAQTEGVNQWRSKFWMSGSAASMALAWQSSGRNASAQVTNAADADEALKAAEAKDYDVILVNRLLASDESSGLDVIDQLIEAGVKSPIMMVSDMSDAQEEAIKHGAVRGFGKADLGDPETLKLVETVATGGKHSKPGA